MTPALIKRVESARGPDREIDVAIAQHFEIDWLDEHSFPGYGLVKPSAQFSSSLDAAVSLCARVLPDHEWAIHKTGYDEGVHQDGKAGAALRAPHMSFFNIRAYAATPALALVLAVLRAVTP